MGHIPIGHNWDSTYGIQSVVFLLVVLALLRARQSATQAFCYSVYAVTELTLQITSQPGSTL